MIPVSSGVRVWLATGVTDMRRGMNSLALQVQQDLGRDPHAGDQYCENPCRRLRRNAPPRAALNSHSGNTISGIPCKSRN